MEKFIAWLEASPLYKDLIFMHGERLLIRRDGAFAILTIELAYQAYIYQEG